MRIIQDQNRIEIRQSIGYNIGDIIVSEVTANGLDASSLIDTYGLQKFTDDDVNGRQVCIFNAAGTIVDGEKSWVFDFDGTNKDATCAPVFTANIVKGDKYEMWHVFKIEEVNDVINQKIKEMTRRCLQEKETYSTWTVSSQYEYNCLSGFEGLYKVEYVSEVKETVVIHACDVVWDEYVDADVTASIDTSINVEGSGCLKLVVAAGASALDILATDSITPTDLTDCDELEIWIRSSVALSAGDYQVLLDDTPSCASPLESLNIPATTANTATYHCISLANPYSDSAIISVGLKMVSDKGAHTIYIDRIRAVNSKSKIYKELNPEQWSIVRSTTNLLKLSEVGSPTQIRLSGYGQPALLSDDTTDSEVDPQYLVAACTAHLLTTHSKSPSLDIQDRKSLGDRWRMEADRLKQEITFTPYANSRWI